MTDATAMASTPPPTAAISQAETLTGDSTLPPAFDPQGFAGKAPSLPRARRRLEMATFIGLISAFVLVAMAIYLGGSAQAFLNGPALMIVFGGTIAVTTISFSGRDIGDTIHGLADALSNKIQKPQDIATFLIQSSEYSRRFGMMRLSEAARKIRNPLLLRRALDLVADGIGNSDLRTMLIEDAEAEAARSRRAAQVFRRGAEVAPAMGLIGTPVGLVQMLGQLDDPSTIGPAMAVALLTTFYGAIFGTMVLSPIAGKLDHRSERESLNCHLIVIGACALARQEGPRRMELLLNAALPPEQRIRYFD